MNTRLLTLIKTATLACSVTLIQSCALQTEEPQLVENAQYSEDWGSLAKHKTPDWFLDAKLGIYFHWGPYSVPAHKTEWYSLYMYQEGHPIRKYHEETYGSLDEFGYKDFVPMFTGEHFDPVDWAQLFKKAGAKFVGPVSEHADGFAMWDSDITPWNAADMGPKRDIMGEMAKAVRSEDMKFIATFHHQWKYAWYPTWDKNTDASDPQFEKLYGPAVPKGTFVMADTPTDPLPGKDFNQEWLDKIKEVIAKYEPDLIYFDNKMDIIDEDVRKEFLTHYYNEAQKQNRDVVVTYKFEDLPKGTAVLDLERSRMSEKMPFPWLTDDSIDWNSWSHVNEPKYKSANRLIDFLIDVVSKNGGVLLNVTPTAQGEIPTPVRERLLELGAWLDVNGEAIYGTRPWKVYGEGPAKVIEGHLSEFKNKDNTEKDIRFTTSGDYLYATVLDWPTQAVNISALAEGLEKIKSIELLGSNEQIVWRQTSEALIIEPPRKKLGNHAFVFKVLLQAGGVK